MFESKPDLKTHFQKFGSLSPNNCGPKLFIFDVFPQRCDLTTHLTANIFYNNRGTPLETTKVLCPKFHELIVEYFLTIKTVQEESVDSCRHFLELLSKAKYLLWTAVSPSPVLTSHSL